MYSSTATEIVEGQQEKVCLHCGLLVPSSRSKLGDWNCGDFCCSGCEYVYRMIHSLGLEGFYRLKQNTAPGIIVPAARKGDSFSQFDDEEFIRRYTAETNEGLKVHFTLAGIYCAACVWLVERLPFILAGVKDAQVNFSNQSVVIIYDPGIVSLSEIGQTLDGLGYSPSPADEGSLAEIRKKEDRALLIRLGVAGVCAGNTMMLAVSLYQGLFTGMEPRFVLFFQWVSLFITIPAVTYSAVPFYKTAFGGLRARSFHIDLPISIGIIGGFFASAVNTFRGSDQIYFDTICMLIFLMLAGRWIQRKSVQRSLDTKSVLYSLISTVARIRQEDGTEKEAFSGSLKKGDTILVRPEEVIPADGVVNKGFSQINSAMLTGESIPIKVFPGTIVYAGTKNLSDVLEIRVENSDRATRVGRLVSSIESVGRYKANISRITDTLSGYFVAVVLLLSLFTAVYAYSIGGVFTALDRTLALLVITCPCALGLSAPLALSIGMRNAAKAGIFIRGEDVIETLCGVKSVLFDKTGTLTTGEMQVVEFDKVEGKTADQNKAYSAIISLEKGVNHPVGKALRNHSIIKLGNTNGDDGDTFNLWGTDLIEGKGAQGRDNKGNIWRIGSYTWLKEYLSNSSSEIDKLCKGLINENLSPVILVCGARVVKVFGVGDRAKPDALPIISELKQGGKKVGIVSGDVNSIVKSFGETLGIASDLLYGGLSPEDKVKIVESFETEARTMVVGDGVNDAASLKESSVGVALSGGAEVCLQIADVFCGRPDLKGITIALEGAQKTLNVIYRNLAFSLVYNVIGAYAAIAGYMNPLLAAVIMPLSSITIIVSSASNRAFKGS